MEKLSSGKETTLLWVPEKPLTHEQLCVEQVDSTLSFSDEEREKIKLAFDEAKAKNPQFFDGTLWRFEGHKDVNGGVDLLVSPTTYMPHNIRRHETYSVDYKDGRFVSAHVNPFSINVVQVTADNYILIGVKGKVADQKGLGVIGAGFIRRKEGFPPANIFAEALREAREEAGYTPGKEPLNDDIEEIRALGAVFGSNHDTTIPMYLPLRATREETGLGNQEHSGILYLEANSKSIERFLADGGMEGIPAVDHCLGDLELFARFIEDLRR